MFSSNASAQQDYSDSLQHQVNNAIEGTTKVLVMRINLYAHFLICLLTTLGILLCNDTRSQTSDTITTINLPLPHEDLSLYDFASVRMETDKTEMPPADITKRKFQPVKEIFEKDEFHFADSVKSVWIKFQIRMINHPIPPLH